jgi:hypothetical protein
MRVHAVRRMRLAVRSWHARWTGAEEGRVWRRNYSGGFARYFTENACDFGDFVANGAIDGALGRALEELGKGATREPYLVLRRAFPRRLLPIGFTARFSPPSGRRTLAPADREPQRLRAFIRKGRFDIVAAALIAAAGAELRKKNQTDPQVFQDFFTDADGAITRFRETRDMWQRFRQATPEFAPDDERPEQISARILLIACAENTIEDPIYVLPAARVLAGLDADTLNALREKQFEFVDGWTWDMTVLRGNRKRIVGGAGDNPENWWLSFDPNRINERFESTSPAGLQAVGRLMQQIDRVSKDATPIVLRRGDAVIIDNYRALVRRKERDWYAITWPWPPVRWLRVYYGFPRSEEHGHNGPSEQPSPAKAEPRATGELI